MPPVVPLSIGELRARYGTQLADGFELVKWPVYHFQTYAAAGQTSLTFFNAVGTDKDLNNMEANASFPAPKKYFVRSLGIHLKPPTAVSISAATAGTAVHARLNDVEGVFNSGHLEFNIGNKQYMFGAPLGLFPTPIVFDGFAGTHFTQAAAADRQLTHGILQNSKNHRDGFLLDPPLFIESQINWTLETRWTTAVTISVVATNGFGVILLGQLIRPMQ